MPRSVVDYFRCPESFIDFRKPAPAGAQGPGYFRFGDDVLCFATSTVGCASDPTGTLADALDQTRFEGASCILPFHPSEATNNLRYERYIAQTQKPLWKSIARETYYGLRPLLPVSIRRHLQRAWLKGWDARPFPRWPVDTTVDRMQARLLRLALENSREECIPFIWFWPEGKSACAIMTHDVETEAGLRACGRLMDFNDNDQIKSSFQLIPEGRYTVTPQTVDWIRERGFEVNVHDLRHDGHLFDNYASFARSAERINRYARRFGSTGFRSGVLYRNQDWFGAFSFSYDMSVPNAAHLDPQPGGCCTVMPYFNGSILELPVTTTQDYTLFHILETYSIELWQTQIEAILARNGLASFIVHPDYLNNGRAVETYLSLLNHLKQLRQHANLWIARPGEVNTWWRQRSQMRLVRTGGSWTVEGPGSERARVALASIERGELHYRIQHHEIANAKSAS
jgi:hypothetical protein